MGSPLSLIDVLLLWLMACVLFLQLHLQFIQKINWDEFFYLSHIYDAQAGRLDKTLQMAHVYLFRWLILIPGGEMVQITVGRVMMWVVQLGTLVFIIKIARNFMSQTAAIFSALCFICIGYVFIHGTSFRADPLAALCMVYAVYIFSVSQLQNRDLLGLAFSLALGVLITIKVVLYAPLFLCLVFWRLKKATFPKKLFFRFVSTAILSALIFVVAYVMHSMRIVELPTSSDISSISNSFQTMFFSDGLFPRLKYMKIGFMTAVLPSLLISVGFIILIWRLLNISKYKNSHPVLLVFLLPLLAFIFYRNAYPYFFSFILPTGIIFAGYAVHHIKFSKTIMGGLAVLMSLNMLLIYQNQIKRGQETQRETLEVIHQAFPEPVSYFDRSGMISSFPKAGFFMSSWGVRNYNKSGERRFIREMEKKTIPLLIENSPAIAAALKGEPSSLFEEDAKALRENYIPHWGHIWVAGKKLTTDKIPINFSILVPGDYTLKTRSPIFIDGKSYKNGSIIYFDRGKYDIESHVKQDVVLRWGQHLKRPDYDSINKPIFGAF